MSEKNPNVKAVHVMVDLETGGLKSNSVVRSCGAVAFAPTSLLATGKVDSAFYANVEGQSQLEQGRIIEESTRTWWASQSEEARRALEDNQLETEEFLNSFENFLGAFKAEGYEPFIWGKGARFDNNVLGSLYTDFGRREPWSYKCDSCYRTVCNLFGDRVDWEALKAETTGLIAHHALSDAMYQSKALLQMIREEDFERMMANMLQNR